MFYLELSMVLGVFPLRMYKNVGNDFSMCTLAQELPSSESSWEMLQYLRINNDLLEKWSINIGEGEVKGYRRE